MREIKYRAFYDNMMFDVACINMYYGNVVLLAVNEEQEKYISTINKKAMINCKNMLSVEMSKVIIEKYTGLKDKNGTEIYEGDIVKRYIFDIEEVIGTIIWIDEGFTGFMLKVEDNDPSRTGCYHCYPIGRGEYDDDDSDRCGDEVLGNIHENPELLEGRE